MSEIEDPRQTYLISLGAELKKLIGLSENKREAGTEEFYRRLHGLDQTSTHGTARTADAGLMDLYAAVSALRPDTPDPIMEQIDLLVQNLRHRSEADFQLRGLGTQPHEIVIKST